MCMRSRSAAPSRPLLGGTLQVELGDGRARAHRIGADAAVAVLDRDMAHEGDHARLGGIVGRLARVAGEGVDGGDRDDGAARALQHRRQHRLHAPGKTQEIDVERGLPVLHPGLAAPCLRTARPALPTRMSIWPQRPYGLGGRCRALVRLGDIARKEGDRLGRGCSCASASRPPSAATSVNSTRAPSVRSFTTQARPIPVAPPVTMATWP